MPIAGAVKNVNWLLPLRNGAAEFLQLASRYRIGNKDNISYGSNEMIANIGALSVYTIFVMLKG